MFNDKFSESNLEKYAKAADPTVTRVLQKTRVEIGNARDFSAWMMKNALDPTKSNLVFCNWNLDADRGYGYKCWKADNLPSKILTGEKFV